MGDDANSWCSLGFAEPSAAYTSATQQARHLTEGWMAEHGFCPACGAWALSFVILRQGASAPRPGDPAAHESATLSVRRRPRQPA